VVRLKTTDLAHDQRWRGPPTGSVLRSVQKPEWA